MSWHLQNLQSQVSSLRQKNQQLESQYYSLKRELESTQHTVRELEKIVSNLETKYDQFFASLRQSLEYI